MKRKSLKGRIFHIEDAPWTAVSIVAFVSFFAFCAQLVLG